MTVTCEHGRHVVDILPGESIHDAVKDAIETSYSVGKDVQFTFNGITVVVCRESREDMIVREWRRAMSGYLGESPTVGPMPVETLSEAEIASDAAIAEVNEKLAAEEAAQWHDEVRRKTELLSGALSVAPELSVNDDEAWQRIVDINDDPYGARTVKYASDVGRILQARYESRDNVAHSMQAVLCQDLGDIETLADDDGITGYMHHCAISLLCKYWTHGQDLQFALDFRRRSR